MANYTWFNQLLSLLFVFIGEASAQSVPGAGLSTESSSGSGTTLTTICKFQSGPKAGTTFDFAPYGVQPIPVGAPCNDGVSSFGIAVAR